MTSGPALERPATAPDAVAGTGGDATVAGPGSDSLDTSPGPVVDPRSRGRRLIAPVATLGIVAACTAYVGAVDPGEPGHYPLCPLRAVFGVDCPGCGGLRCVHALTRGDVAAAADFNLLAVVLLPLAVVAWIVWFRRAWTGVSPAPTAAEQRARSYGAIALVVLMLVFGVVRNLVPYLGSVT